jgi:adenylate cyclase
MKDVAAQSTQESLSRALDAERVRNSSRLAWVRFLAVSAVFGVTLYLGYLRGLVDWAVYAPPFAVYWSVTALAL